MARVDWTKIRTEYISNETITLRVLAEKHGVSETAVFEKSSKEKWPELRANALAEAKQELSKRTGESIADVNARHIQTAKILQTKGMVAIIGDEKNGVKPIPITSFDHARKAVDSGVTMERRALGLDKDGSSPSVNVFVAVSTDQKKYGF